MAQIVILKVSSVGEDVSAFDLYSDSDSFAVPFEEDIPASALVAGYTSSLVPDDATEIRLTAIGVCSGSLNSSIDTTEFDSNPPTGQPTIELYYTLNSCIPGYPAYSTRQTPAGANQRYILLGQVPIFYTWNNQNPTNFITNPENPDMELMVGLFGCP
jgi:hypothetical protein